MSFLAKAVSVESRLEDRAIEDIKEVINKVNKVIQSRNKLIRIADKTKEGWSTMEQYSKVNRLTIPMATGISGRPVFEPSRKRKRRL